MKNFSKLDVGMSIVILGMNAVCIVLSYVNVEIYTGLIKEDRLVEWMSFGALAAVSVLCFSRCYRLWNEKSRLFLAMLFLMGLLFLFGAGEEISWGQRIFNIESPEFFVQANLQKEMNLHNLQIGNLKVNRVIFGKVLGILIAFYLLVIPFMARRWDKFYSLLSAFAVPIPRWIHGLCFILIFLLVNILNILRKGELIEYTGSLVFFWIFLQPHNQSRLESSSKNGAD